MSAVEGRGYLYVRCWREKPCRLFKGEVMFAVKGKDHVGCWKDRLCSLMKGKTMSAVERRGYVRCTDVDCWYVWWKVRLCHLSLSGADHRNFSSCTMFLQYTTCSLTINNNAVTINNNAVTINNNVTESQILLLWSCDFVKPKKSLEFSTWLDEIVYVEGVFITAVNNV